jgi:predicted alpha/beta-hydrolase family hydrolase
MLFLQGTRDSLADIDSMRAVCKGLGKKATLEIIDGGDHSFKTPAAMRLSYDDVLADLVQRVSRWSIRT